MVYNDTLFLIRNIHLFKIYFDIYIYDMKS